MRGRAVGAEAASWTARPRKPPPPVTRTRRSPQKSDMGLEASGPGPHSIRHAAATAVTRDCLPHARRHHPRAVLAPRSRAARRRRSSASLDALAATARLEVVGVAARHGGPPAAPFRPSVPVRHLPLPRASSSTRPGTGRTAPLAAGAAGHRPGRRRARHGRRRAACGRRPLVVTIHDLAFLADPGAFTRHGSALLPARHRAGAPSRRSRASCRRRRRPASAAPPASTPTASGSCPGATDRPPATAEAVAAVRGRHGLPERYVLFVGTLEPRKNLAPARRRPGAAPPAPTCRSCSPVPTGWGDAGAPGAAPGSCALGFVDRGRARRPLRRRRRRRLPEPARGLRPARARGDGPGRARAHVERAPPPRRSPATPPSSSTRSTATPSPTGSASCSTTTAAARDLGARAAAGRPRSPGRAAPTATLAAYRELAGGR